MYILYIYEITSNGQNQDISLFLYNFLSEAVDVLSFLLHLDHQEALTEFERMATISVDDALNKVINMRNNYLEQKGFRPYQDTDGRWRGYVYQTIDGKRKRIAKSAQTIEEVEKKH